jgi:hypothetical protein
MQIDMHYYGVYALCRLAGIASSHAQRIAHASQFVDDNVQDENLIFRQFHQVLPPFMSAHKPIDVKNANIAGQWKVWAAFHFLPGNEAPHGRFEEKMICRRNSELAKQIMNTAINACHTEDDLYAVGIAAHSFADTFAHYGFIGISTSWNRVKESSIQIHVKSTRIDRYLIGKFNRFIDGIKGDIAETIPVGHGAVATYPDRPYLKWEYSYEKGRRPKVKRENWRDFSLAAQLLHQYFGRMRAAEPWLGDVADAVNWETCKDAVLAIIKKEGKKHERIDAWKTFIKSGTHFTPDEIDLTVSYQPLSWLITKKRQNTLTQAELHAQPLYHFVMAARQQAKLVMHYLREQDIIVT